MKVAIRLDELAMHAAEHAVKKHVEPRASNFPLWDLGLGDVAREFVKERIPASEVTMVDVARKIGLLRPEVRRRVRA